MDPLLRDDRQAHNLLHLRRPAPESIREAAQTTGLPVDKVTEVRVLDPYFYK